MKLHTLKPAKGSTKNRKRIGRGEGSGHGGTSTRGHKGAKSRSGYSRKLGFEGGQMPLHRRVPKFGFKNINRVEYKVVNLPVIQALAEKHSLSEFGVEDFAKYRLASKTDLVKVLNDGEFTANLNITAHKFSAAAQAAIEKNGGTANALK